VQLDRADVERLVKSGCFDSLEGADVYARFCRKLSQRCPYLLKGIVDVEEEFGVATLRVC
jgi:error-prone DNA polymerase